MGSYPRLLTAREGITRLIGSVMVGVGRLTWLILAGLVVYFVVAGHSQVPWADFGRDPGGWAATAFFGFLTFVGLLGGSVALVAFGGKLRSIEPGAALADGAETPIVLYLRSFNFDRAVEDQWSEDASSLVSGAGSVFAGTAEERMLRPFKVFGRVLAVGRPGERLPTRGAERIYVGEQDWQSTVLDLVDRASLVVLAPDASPGIRWEMELAFKVVSPESLIVVLPNPATAEAEVLAACARLGCHPPTDARRAFAFGFTADGCADVLVTHRTDGGAPAEVWYAVMRRRGLQPLLRREAWGRAAAGLGLLGFLVMVPVALLAATVLATAVAAGLGFLLLGVGLVDRRPLIGISAVVGLTLLLPSLLDLSFPPAVGLAALGTFLTTVTLAYSEAAFKPSGRLVRQVRRSISAGRLPERRKKTPVEVRSREFISRHTHSRPRR